MNRPKASRQRGVALLVLLGIIAIGASWFLVSKLDALSANFAARDRNSNAAVLNRAKQALIGYVAAQALKPGENNPGSLPCPENPGDFDSTTGNDGRTGSGCGNSLKVGRFPWRTIGTEKLVDASGEPLWYVVSTNWGVPTGGNTSINSNSVGQLTLDGVPNAAIALIIAPGPAFAVPAATGCIAWNQARPTTGTPDWRNYLECDNATSPADASFATTGPAGSFNDQVIRVTVAHIMPALEAAIANRIEREIAPILPSVYTASFWPQFFATASPPRTVSAANPLYPYAAPFASPGPGAGTSNYQGTSGVFQGLMPFNQTVGCTPSASDPRCNTTIISFSGTPYKASGYGSIQGTPTCSVTGEIYECQGEYLEDPTNAFTLTQSMRVEIAVTLNNVFGGLRTILDNASIPNVFLSRMAVEARDDVILGPWQAQAHNYTYAINTDGSVTFTFGATLPNIDVMGWGTYAQFRVRFDKSAMFGDHALLSSADPTTGWFVRNEWYRLAYYAVASGHTATGLATAPSCTTAGTCLTVANGDPTRPIAPVGGQRAILILAGRSINGLTRPNATLADYLEFGNATGAFERQPISSAVAPALKKPFNDRVVVVESN